MFIYAFLILLPVVVFAQGTAQLENELFTALDQNGDGHITKAEAYFLVICPSLKLPVHLSVVCLPACLPICLTPYLPGCLSTVQFFFEIIRNKMFTFSQSYDTNNNKEISPAEFQVGVDKLDPAFHGTVYIFIISFFTCSCFTCSYFLLLSRHSFIHNLLFIRHK